MAKRFCIVEAYYLPEMCHKDTILGEYNTLKQSLAELVKIKDKYQKQGELKGRNNIETYIDTCDSTIKIYDAYKFSDIDKHVDISDLEWTISNEGKKTWGKYLSLKKKEDEWQKGFML